MKNSNHDIAVTNSTRNINLQPVTRIDESALHKHFKIVLTETFRDNQLLELDAMLKEEIEDKKRFLSECLISDGKDRFFLLAMQEGHILGCIEFGPSNALIDTCTQGELKDMLEIGTAFVLPENQHMGIGRKLLKGILKELHNRKIQNVCFDSGYKTAQAIWTNLFGQPKYFLKDYWEEGAHHMVWVLDVEKEIRRL